MITGWKPAPLRLGRPLVIARRKSGPIGGLLVIAAALGFGTWAMLAGWNKNAPGDMPTFGAGVLAVSRFMWRAVVRPRVDVFADGLQVIGFWDRCWIPSAAVRRIDAADGMTISTVHGDNIPVFAFSRSLLDRGQSEAAAAQMRRAKTARQGAPEETPEAVRSPDWTWFDLLFIPLPVLMLLAATGIYGTWS